MAAKTFEELQARMIAETAAKATETLCDALLLLNAMVAGCKMDNAEHLTEAVISDELCRRYPEVNAAADRWVEDPAMWEMELTEVIVAAALAALKAQK
jgi:hypothetical protein